MKKKKILITGVAGFIGFSLARKIIQYKNFEVVGIDNINSYYNRKLKLKRLSLLKNKNFKFYKIDLIEKNKLYKLFEKNNFDIVFNFAAQAGVRYSIENPKIYLNSNIIGTFNVIECAKKLNIKHLIIGSSSSVYGANKKFPFQEIDKTDSQISFYAATKKSTESIAHSYSSLWKIPITVLRFFTVYGPWGRPDMAYFKFTKNILRGKKIDVYNKGKMYRDYTYIDDIVDGIVKLTNKIPKLNSSKKYKNDSISHVAPIRTLNIGNTKKVLLSDFISAIEKNLNKKAVKRFLPMQKGDVYSTLSDSSLLRRITGYNPKTKYKDGIKKFLNWYLDYYS